MTQLSERRLDQGRFRLGLQLRLFRNGQTDPWPVEMTRTPDVSRQCNYLNLRQILLTEFATSRMR